jgi:hypothetical protein
MSESFNLNGPKLNDIYEAKLFLPDNEVFGQGESILVSRFRAVRKDLENETVDLLHLQTGKIFPSIKWDQLTILDKD